MQEEEYFPLHPHWTLVGTSEQIELRQEKQVKKMKTLVVFLLCLVLLTVYTGRKLSGLCYQALHPVFFNSELIHAF